jgi:hypothetical protein
VKRFLGIMLAGLVAPGAALGHASERAIILTMPTGPYIWGAALAVAITALVAAAGGRLPQLRARILFERRVLVGNGVTSGLAALGLWGLVLAGLFGTHDPLANPLPLVLWTVIWVGLTVLVVIFGDLWRDINPWRGPVRALRGLLGRQGGIGLARFGHLPAVIGYLAFAWFEIASLAPDDPAKLAVVVAGYWLVILALAVAEGEAWLDRGEFMSVYFALVAKIAPFWAERQGARLQIMAGWPGAQITRLPQLGAGLAAFVTLVIASVSFDGLHETFWWLGKIGVNPLEYPGRSGVVGASTLGLLAMWALMAGLIGAAIAVGLRVSGGHRGGFRAVAGPLMLSFLPIAAGYHIAHYLVALLTQGQYAIAAVDDPLDSGLHLLGLPDHWVSFGFLTQAGPVALIWQAQVAIILGAHLLAVILAEKVSARSGIVMTPLGKVPLALLMVLYTALGLWLLASPAVS